MLCSTEPLDVLGLFSSRAAQLEVAAGPAGRHVASLQFHDATVEPASQIASNGATTRHLSSAKSMIATVSGYLLARVVFSDPGDRKNKQITAERQSDRVPPPQRCWFRTQFCLQRILITLRESSVYVVKVENGRSHLTGLLARPTTTSSSTIASQLKVKKKKKKTAEENRNSFLFLDLLSHRLSGLRRKRLIKSSSTFSFLLFSNPPPRRPKTLWTGGQGAPVEGARRATAPQQ